MHETADALTQYKAVVMFISKGMLYAPRFQNSTS
jgi:hypothetical protein